MELPNSKIQKKYRKEVEKIEAELKESRRSGAEEEKLEKIQKRLDTLTQKLEEIDRKVKAQEAERQVYFFHRSPLAVAILTFITGGIYTLYWFYKHWRAIQQSSGKRTHPILGAIFQVFTVYHLFRYIKEGAQQSGYDKFNQASAAAIAYILLSAFSVLLGLPFLQVEKQVVALLVVSAVIGICYSLILAFAQKAANARNVAVFGKNHKFRRFYVGEIIFTVMGVILYILSTLVLTGVIDDRQPSAESPQVKLQRIKVERLEKQFDTCSNALEKDDTALDESDEKAMNQYNATYDACEKVRLELNKEIDEYNRRLFSW